MIQSEKEQTAPGSLATFTVFSTGADRSSYYWCKRLLDVLLGSLLLVVLSPLLLLIAILIRMDSRGPALYVQERIGSRRRNQHGQKVWEVRSFLVYKFRSMFSNADPSIHQQFVREFVNGRAPAQKPATPEWKLKNDPRVTRFGRILRKTSLDELPQLWNVLRGEMSLVGPRPIPVYELSHYTKTHYERLAALPGITGAWQVQGRCRVSFEEMMRMDIDYVRYGSLWLDLKILWLTVPAVISGRGAE
jgi:lipopolysaccharide/colanic/teichoic acid biosynthesis glycosyltransferase